MILTVEEVERLHRMVIEKTGGLRGIRDKGLLISAVSSCMQTFEENELYPTVEEKAARMAYALCKCW